MRPKEVVHVTFGTPANHVATHFWNTQEAYMEYGPSDNVPLVDHDVSFREGLGVHGESTFTPRALFFDVRPEFGTLRTHNALYGAEEDDEMRQKWQGEVVQTGETIESSWYVDQLRREDEGTATEDGAAPRGRALQYWSDYARCMLHPRSLVPVSAPSLHGTAFLQPGVQAFDTYEQGYAVAQAMEREHAILDDNVRWLAEDSDLMQAFQVTSSASDAFSGVNGAYLAWLADEYPKTERVVFQVASRAPTGDDERSKRLRKVYAMNQVLSLTASLDLATLQVPLGTEAAQSEHVHYNADNLYERSAVMATYMETATLSTRLHELESWGRIVSQLNWRKDTKVAQLGGVFPTPLLAAIRAKPDPSDALIAAMFAARNMRIDTPQSDPSEAAAVLGRNWHDTSFSYSQGMRAGLDDHEDASPVVRPTPTAPFAEMVVARDADPMAETPTLAAVHKWNPAQSPLLHVYVVPLTQHIFSSCLSAAKRLSVHLPQSHAKRAAAD